MDKRFCGEDKTMIWDMREAASPSNALPKHLDRENSSPRVRGGTQTAHEQPEATAASPSSPTYTSRGLTRIAFPDGVASRIGAGSAPGPRR